MKISILLRTLRSLLSIFVVTALTYTIIYTMVPRRLIFRQDPNYNKIAKTADSKANYENTIYERMGYIDYYDTKELQEKASSLDKSVTTKPTKENKAIYQKYVDSLGHGWRLHQFKQSKQFYATRDVPVLERVFGFYTHLFEFDNTGWVKDKTNPNLKRYIRIENDPAIGWSVVGSGTKHKYLLYFNSQFPFVHQNFVKMNLGTSYPTYAEVRYWNGSGTSSGWVNSAALVWVGSNSSKPKPSGSRATASDLSRKPDDTWNSLTVTYSDGDEAQTVSLQTLGVAMSEIYMDGEFLRVPTASLSWETEADDNQRIAVIYAPSTGKCTMREEASKKGKIIMTCKAGRVVTVLRVGDVYTRIVYDGVEGLVLNSCLKFYETPDEDTFTTGLLSAKGKTNTTATVSVYQLTKSRRRLDKIRVGAYLAVMDKVGEWYEVDVNGWHGFVKDANVTLDAPLPD